MPSSTTAAPHIPRKSGGESGWYAILVAIRYIRANQSAKHGSITSLASLIKRQAGQTNPNNPDNPVQHPAALSDYNNGATLIAQGWCVHIFPSNLQIGEAGGNAPV
jgi:hypothetical protein